MVRQAILLFVTVILFGVLVPLLKGFAFLDPLMILCYACLGVLYVAPASAEAFGTAGDRSKGPVFRKMLTLLMYGWGLSFLLLAAGIVTVNVTNWHGKFIGPRPSLIVAALLLSASACAAAIASSGVIAGSYGPKVAKTVLRLGFLLLLLGLVYGYRHLPEDARFQLEMTLTTSGLTRLAYQSSAVLAVVSIAVTGWWLGRLRAG